MRIQWYWTFCRSVTSATSRPNSVLMPPMTRSCVAGQLAAVDADPHHEVLVLELLGLQHGGLAAGDALGALGVEAHPAHAAAQVAGVDAVEAGLRVDVDDPLTDLETVGVLLHPLVGVERLPVAQSPLALAALGAVARAGGGRHVRYFFLRLSPHGDRRGCSGGRCRFGVAVDGCAGGPGSARGATGGAGDAREIDVQARDEGNAAAGHAVDGATARPGRRRGAAHGTGACDAASASAAERAPRLVHARPGSAAWSGRRPATTSASGDALEHPAVGLAGGDPHRSRARRPHRGSSRPRGAGRAPRRGSPARSA